MGAGVDVGREYLDVHLPAFVDVLDNLGHVAGFRGEKRGHEIDGEVGLEVRGGKGQDTRKRRYAIC